jgi:broad specificity phosphatase PhoE
MRTLEVRRHSVPKKGSERGSGSYLSREGVSLAQQVGASTGPFAYVLATPIPRTVETAIAMGWAVDEVVDVGLDDAFWEEAGRYDHWTWDEPFSSYREAIAAGGSVARVGAAQRETWLSALDRISEGDAVLAVSHGHAIESGLVTCIDEIQTDVGAGPFEPCEGFRCTYADGAFINAEILRLSR